MWAVRYNQAASWPFKMVHQLQRDMESDVHLGRGFFTLDVKNPRKLCPWQESSARESWHVRQRVHVPHSNVSSPSTPPGSCPKVRRQARLGHDSRERREGDR
jgi:hypothetical protein